ncbi:hypothetical protein V1512DRAFT_111282 [Lipomyces arxii]|uniref:uncharacterized protein n=1 Tax=Lipomyces arxii TaxID=56418 RepID=UPI0034CF7BDF
MATDLSQCQVLNGVLVDFLCLILLALDFGVRKAVLESINLQYPTIRAPTLVQSALLSALLHQNSFVCASPSGTGKSFATAAHLISQPRYKAPLPSVSSLVLVPSTELGFQYIEVISSLLRSGNAPLKTQEIVQFVYRSSMGPEDEKLQLDLLSQCPAPNILIATPNRLLDMLADPEQTKYLNLGYLKTVVIDEADDLIRPDLALAPTPKSKSQKKKKHKRPVLVAMDYILKLRKAALATYSLKVPLQVILLTSAITSGDDLYHFASNSSWIKAGRTNTYGVAGYSGLSVSTPFVDTYTVTFDPTTKTLQDMSMNDETQESVRYKPITSDITRNDLIGLKMLLKEDGMKKAVVIIPADASHLTIRSTLRDIGVSAVSLNYFGGTKIIDSDQVHGYGLIDTQTMFDKSTDSKTVSPDIILASANQLAGLHFPGLSRIYVVGGSNAVSRLSEYSTLLLRTRVSTPRDIEMEAFNPDSIRAAVPAENARVVFVTVNDEAYDDRRKLLQKFIDQHTILSKRMFSPREDSIADDLATESNSLL